MPAELRNRNILASSPSSSNPDLSSYELGERTGNEAKHPPNKAKKDRPWKQQNLPAYQPILTPGVAATPLVLLALILIPVGAYIHYQNKKTSDIMFDYTQCSSATPTFQAPSQPSTHIMQWKYDPNTRTCTLQLSFDWALHAPVLFYIRLTNFYQNHRLYTKSLSADQVAGKAFLKAGDITGDCSWLRYANCDTARSSGKWNGPGNPADANPDCMKPADQRDEVIRNADPDAQYYPCGLIANSMFSDSISELRCVANCQGPTTYTFTDNDVSWPEDREQYGVSEWKTNPTLAPDIHRKLIPPPAWRTAFPEYANGYNSSNLPDLGAWQRFQVWMRPAGMPTFRKLWGKNTTTTLGSGTWELDIVDRFDVTRFDGTKSLLFSTLGPVGSRDSFLGVAYLAVGCTFAFAAFLIYVARFRKLGDRSYLSWNSPKSHSS